MLITRGDDDDEEDPLALLLVPTSMDVFNSCCCCCCCCEKTIFSDIVERSIASDIVGVFKVEDEFIDE